MRRSVELAWIGGRMQLNVEVPAEYAPAESDYSPFVPVALMAAMRRAEPLQIDGGVSPRLLRTLPHSQEVISAMNPTLRRVAVRAAAFEETSSERAPGRGCLFSRGVDSNYSAAVERPPGEEVQLLVHWRDFLPLYSERTIELEVERVRQAARLIGLPLVVVRSDVTKALANVVDFNDATSAMLASVMLSLPGLAGHQILPSALGYADLQPLGTTPLLDGLWSTERVEIEHDSCVPNRDDKVAWLVRNRPDLVEQIHVCMEHDDLENCGRCGKCIWTMLLLHLSGGLAAAPFPDLDPKAVRRVPRPSIYHLRSFERVHAELSRRPEDAALRKAVEHVLRISTREPMPAGELSMIAQYSRRIHFLMRGKPSGATLVPAGVASAEVAELDPSWPPPRGEPAGVTGLVRGVDHAARGHRYAAGELPAGQRSGELGGLLAEAPDDGVALHLGADGRPQIELPAESPSPGAIARWVLAPLAWRRDAGLSARVRSVGRRTVDVGRRGRRKRRGGRPAAAVPAGWLHASAGDGRVELHAAQHPVLDDVLLTTDPREAAELGYRPAVSLGFLEASAPLTGALGTTEVVVPWARRWGRRG